MSDITEVETIRISPRTAWNKIKALKAENATLKEENDHLDNVIQGLHHDLDVLRKLVEI